MLPRNVIICLGFRFRFLPLGLPASRSAYSTLLRFFDVDVYPLVIRVGLDKATDPALEVIKLDRHFGFDQSGALSLGFLIIMPFTKSLSSVMQPPFWLVQTHLT